MASAVLSPASPAARAAARAECAAAERRHEEARQAALREKRHETTRLATDGEDHRREVDDALAARKRILDEMSAVRSKVHSDLRLARKQGRHDTESANRALAAAGRCALDARAEAELWHAKAAEAEAHKRAIWERNEASFRRHKMGQDSRVDEAEAHSSCREDHAQRITQEAHNAFRELHQRHDEHCTTQETHSAAAANHKALGALRADKGSLAQVDRAKALAAKSQLQSAREMRESREAAIAKVTTAQQELADRHRQCQDLLAQERVCASQAKKIAAYQKDVHDADYLVHLGRMEAKLELAKGHLGAKDPLPLERAQEAAARNEAWEAKNQQLLEGALSRAEKEEVEARQRVERAKVALANLQAHCAAHFSELLKSWEDAKRADSVKVKAAAQKTEDVLRYCQECLRQHEEHSALVLERTKEFADAKTVLLEARASTVADLAEQRVGMMQQQSKERRLKAEQQLEQLRRHIEDVRERCSQRVSAELLTASEKVRLTRERHEALVDRAERRAQEAEEEQQAARCAFDAVTARCRGAAEEARRRGLYEVADIIEPPPPLHEETFVPAWTQGSGGCISADVEGWQEGVEEEPVTAEEGSSEAGTMTAMPPLGFSGTQGSLGRLSPTPMLQVKAPLR